MAVGQKGRGNGYVKLVGAGAGYAILAILPKNTALFIHQDDAIVRAPIFRVRGTRKSNTAGNPCSGDERQLANTLRVICANDRIRSRRICSVSKLPNNFMGLWIDFNDSVIELVGNYNIAFLIELSIFQFVGLSRLDRDSTCNNHAYEKEPGSQDAEPDVWLSLCIRLLEFRHCNASFSLRRICAVTPCLVSWWIIAGRVKSVVLAMSGRCNDFVKSEI